MSGEPKRGAAGLLAWLDDRTGYRAFHQRIADISVDGGATWSRALGNAVIATLLVQSLAGLALMAVYAPSTTAAWSSVHYLSYTQAGGWFARGLHHWASHVLVVLVVAHLGLAIGRRVYAAPAEVAWWLLLARGALVLGLAITGHALPWDQSGYWARRVEVAIAGMTPALGPTLARWVQGGASLGQLALTRFYALHVGVLPLLLSAFTVLHIGIERRAAVKRRDVSGATTAQTPYFPAQAARDGALLVLVLLIAAALTVHARGAPLSAPADAASDYPARPEWFLLPLFMVRKLASGPWEFLFVAGVPAILVGYLLALPWIDKGVSATRGARAPVALVGLLSVIAIGVSLRRDAHDKAFVTAQSKADARAVAAIAIAKQGVPPEGPLVMLRRDAELRGEELFAKHCATCHILGNLGNEKDAIAPTLDGFGLEAWIEAVMHDPDANERFGKTAFTGLMPSVDVPNVELAADGPPFRPMTLEDRHATAVFLASEGDEATDVPKPSPRDAALVAKGEATVRERCTTCHMYKGQGDDSNQEVAPELSGYGSLAWVKAQIANPATKATYREHALDAEWKKHMPRYDHELSPLDIELVARWTRGHARGVSP